MPNWVSTRVIAFPTEGNESFFETLLDDIIHPQGAHFEEFLGASYRTFFVEDPYFSYGGESVFFQLNSAWIHPFAFLESLVSYYRCRILFVFSDETEGVHEIDYTAEDWPFQTGAAGIGEWTYTKNGCSSSSYHAPASPKEYHEMFLMAWNWNRPVDGGYPDFFNQTGIDDKYFLKPLFCEEDDVSEEWKIEDLPRLSEWIRSFLTQS